MREKEGGNAFFFFCYSTLITQSKVPVSATNLDLGK